MKIWIVLVGCFLGGCILYFSLVYNAVVAIQKSGFYAFHTLLRLKRKWKKENELKQKILIGFQSILKCRCRAMVGGSTLERIILNHILVFLSPTWLSLLAEQDVDFEIACTHTIGHELAHQMNDIPLPPPNFVQKRKFTSWVRECRADCIGIEFVSSCYPQYEHYKILNAISRKQSHNNKFSNKGNELNTHPEDSFRLEIMKKYSENFGRSAINEIAAHCEYNECKYIEELVLWCESSHTVK